MRRIIFEVPRWSVYLHREARGIDQPDHDDVPRRRFEDELFERLYAGAAEELPASKKQSSLRRWAEEAHAACDQLPSFGRLQMECRGDSDSAATAVESVMADLELVLRVPDRLSPPVLRRVLLRGCEKAANSVEELRDARDALEHVAISPGGSATTMGESAPDTVVRSIAQRLRTDERLCRILLLAGRFKRIAAKKQRQRLSHGADEIADIEQGSDIGRLLPAELVKLTHPRLRLLLLRDFLEARCTQYRLHGTESLGRGPLVVCLDKSGSMAGRPDEWATAVALALLDLAHRQRRPFALLAFDGGVKFETIVGIGDEIPEEALFVSCGGGTDIGVVLARALEIIAVDRGALQHADIVLVTDGQSVGCDAARFRAEARGFGITVLGMGIGVTVESMAPWCDEAYSVTDLDRVNEQPAEALFGR